MTPGGPGPQISGVRTAAVLVLALALPTRATPATCPGAGFDAVDCDMTLVTATVGCAPRPVRAVVKRVLRRVARGVALAARADGRGEPHVAAVQLARAADRVDALARKLAALRDRSRLADDCARAVAEPVDRLAADLEALRAGPSPTTTLTNPTGSTTTSSTVLGSTTTTTTSTTTTTEPTCGNGRLDPGEQCDGTNLFGRDCLTLGFHGGGQLMCRPDCLFETRDCRR